MEVVAGSAAVADVDAFLAELSAVGERHGCAVQAFDARYVVGHEHLARAVALADRAFERGENVARDRAVEILLYAAGRRQIDRAVEMGVGEGEGDVVVVAAAPPDEGGKGGGDADPAPAGEGSPEDREAAAAEAVAGMLGPTAEYGVEGYDADLVRAFFDVPDAEVAAAKGDVADLVLERVALLAVNK